MSTAPQTAPIPVAVVGGLVFVVSDAVTFAALLGGAVALRSAGRDWPAAHTSMAQLALLTLLLFAGSLAIWVARRLNKPRVLLAAAALGLAFVGAELLEWKSLLAAHEGPSADLRHASLFVVTGLHGLHVLVGGLLLTRAGLQASIGNAARILSFYWLALDLAWVGIVGALYL